MMPMLPATLVTAVRPFFVRRLRPDSRNAVQKDMLVLFFLSFFFRFPFCSSPGSGT